LQDWLDKYKEAHRNPVNQTIHFVCVPIIFVTLLCLLDLYRVFTLSVYEIVAPVSLGWILALAAVIFYLRLSLLQASILGTLAVLVLVYARWAEHSYPVETMALHAALFALAWLGQLIGHKIEGAKPAFLEDLTFLLIGPLWISHSFVRRFSS
jgi:uncharacterized membrane protein YGL010W